MSSTRQIPRPASIVSELIVEKYPDCVPVLLHVDNYSSKVGDRLFRLHSKQTPLYMSETNSILYDTMGVTHGAALLTELFPVVSR